MSEVNPIELLFGGMDKLGLGSEEDTINVLNLLPKKSFQLVVDVGCGSGRQTLTLAKELKTVVHAVDTYEPFLTDGLTKELSLLILSILLKIIVWKWQILQIYSMKLICFGQKAPLIILVFSKSLSFGYDSSN